ncbi:hypothetical protein TNCV_3735711 [Trichonephila clavipes]|nr:hypothetical protein TNCV_3735711 [Trichonephila clavipes]
MNGMGITSDGWQDLIKTVTAIRYVDEILNSFFRDAVDRDFLLRMTTVVYIGFIWPTGFCEMKIYARYIRQSDLHTSNLETFSDFVLRKAKIKHVFPKLVLRS